MTSPGLAHQPAAVQDASYAAHACRGDQMPLTPEDVRNWEFGTTRFRPGYDQHEVDAFLELVEEELVDRDLQA